MRIIVTIGDCNGIGLEAFIKSLYFNIDYFIKRKNVSFTIAGNSQTIKEYIRLLNLDAQIRNKQLLIKDISCEIEEIENYSSVEFGKVNNLSGLLSARSIEYAVEATLKGEYDAILTLPVLKKALYLAGWQYPGHTEMLAKKCNVNEPLMILFKDDFRVALATIHIPLMKVPENITTSKIINVTQIFHNSLVQDFGIKNPRIAILGLNPHAGEEGSIGIEEKDVILPAIHNLQEKGMNAEGAFPADSFFAHSWLNRFDGVIAMYHDQGLIPLKQYSQGSGVNFTAGLPIVRTSPSHGTAYDIAGKGIANWVSTYDAIFSAIEIVKNRKKINS